MGKRRFKFTILVMVVLITLLVLAVYLFKITDPQNLVNIDQADVLMPVVLIAVCLVALLMVLHWLLVSRNNQKLLSIIRTINTDYLTGMPNQQCLLRDLSGTKHTNLALIKLHHQTSILNTYGPAITDDVLRQVAGVITQFDHPMLAKPNSYHVQPGIFAILEDQDTSFERIQLITKALVRDIMTTQYQVGDGQWISLNVTVGAVRQNKDAYMLAYMALQEAESKELQFYLYDGQQSNLPDTYKKELELTQLLIKGINDLRIKAYYQPICSAVDESVQKYEALARLVNERGEVIMMPNVFMPLAHRAKVYYLITMAMIKQAIKFAAKHQVEVSVNLSISDINNKRTCDFLFHKLKKSEVAHLIHFELLENEAIVGPDAMVSMIDHLHDLGCQVGMDDLGKGHSNIERLINLQIDFVKIDQAIMENILHDSEMRNLAKGMVKLAHKKGLKVIAEYCTDKAVTTAAKEIGVDYLQGFYLGKPQATIQGGRSAA